MKTNFAKYCAVALIASKNAITVIFVNNFRDKLTNMSTGTSDGKTAFLTHIRRKGECLWWCGTLTLMKTM